MWTKIRIVTAIGLTATLLSSCDRQLPPPTPVSQEEVTTSQAAESNDAGSEAAPTPPLPQKIVSGEAQKFLKAINSDNPSAIRSYFPVDYPESELAPDSTSMHFIHHALRPILAKGAMDAKEVAREGHLFMVVFYLIPFEKRLNDKAYLESDYMKTFFVCNFDDTSGRWILSSPIMCYDETEGPYEPQPDV